ncbi:MAG: sugar phosphate isomerase/epimerase [Treponema sp.]|nr:sugar phosphate isomerase/epimerase [Treponema sp.]
MGSWIIERAARDGFDYVELPLAQIMDLGQDEFNRLCDKLLSLGVKCRGNNNFFPPGLRLTGPQADEAGIGEYIEGALSRSRSLGVTKVVFGSGPARNIPPGFPPDEGKEQIIRLLRRGAQIAAKYGISIVIEPLNREESNIINSFEEGCRIAAGVSRENVKVLVDYYHLVKENEPLEHICQWGKDFLFHTHFAGDGSARKYPAAEGKEAYTRFMKALKDTGYDDTLSLEARDDDPLSHMKPALLMLRELWEGL